MGTQTGGTGGGERGVPGEPPNSLHEPSTTRVQDPQPNDLSHNPTDAGSEQQPGNISSSGIWPEPEPGGFRRSGRPWNGSTTDISEPGGYRGAGGPWDGSTANIPTNSSATRDCVTGGAREPRGPKDPRTPGGTGRPRKGEGDIGEPLGTVQQLNNKIRGTEGENSVDRGETKGKGYKATKIVTLNIQVY